MLDQRTDQITAAFIRRRTSQHLATAPLLIAHILDNVLPTRRTDGNSGTKRTKRDDPPTPANLTAIQDANDLYALLINWVTDHARRLNHTPPANALPFMRVDTDCKGLPYWAKRADAIPLTTALTSWLTQHADQIEELPAATEWQRDLDEQMRIWTARYPLQISEPTLPRPCPLCRHWKVTVAWSVEPGHYDEFKVVCGHCGFEIPAELYVRALAGISL